MTTAVVGGAPAGGEPSQRIPETVEKAEAKRRYWNRFFNAQRDCKPEVTQWEVNRFALAVRPAPGQRVIDVGCGRGTFAAAISVYGPTVTGYDWSGVAVEYAQWKYRDPNLSYEEHDFLGGRAPAGVEDGSLDIVICRASLQYLDQAFLDAASRWLRPDTGFLYVVLPVNERQPPESAHCGFTDAAIERLRDGWTSSTRWHLDWANAYAALLLRGPRPA